MAAFVVFILEIQAEIDQESKRYVGVWSLNPNFGPGVETIDLKMQKTCLSHDGSFC